MCGELVGKLAWSPIDQDREGRVVQASEDVWPKIVDAPPAAMGTVLEVFNEDHLAHPWNPHVFVVPRLMTHLWRKSLGKDMDVMFTVQVGKHLWASSQHEPLIVALVLPLSHVDNYRGPWLAAGTSQARELVRELDLGFKFHKNP